MFAQLTFFDGPRSPELIAAAHRAGRDRITPAVLADPRALAGHIATYVIDRPDGGQLVVSIASDEASLDRAREVIMSTELLPGEDPALLVGPDRAERCIVVQAVEHGRVVHPVEEDRHIDGDRHVAEGATR